MKKSKGWLPEHITFLVGRENPDSAFVASDICQRFPNLKIEIVHEISSLNGGDWLIALSFPQRVPAEKVASYRLATVMHASSLPKGRGWSPANWMLENLETSFTITLLKMSEKIDSGDIIDQREFQIPISGLYADLRVELIKHQVALIESLLTGTSSPSLSRTQKGTPTYFDRRHPGDSEIDPEISISQQWGKIRAADSFRYPNYFYLHGRKFKLSVERMEEGNEH